MKANKFDQKKAPVTMIPRSAIEQEALVLKFGAEKYGRDNWKQGMDYTRLLDAAMRHIIQFTDGEDLDPESGLSHLAHARCSLGFLIEYIEKGLGKDDRYKETKENLTLCMEQVPEVPEALSVTLSRKIEAAKNEFEPIIRECDGRSSECDVIKNWKPSGNFSE